jgi:nitrate reductase delta subunit
MVTMNELTIHKDICRNFAYLLSYPNEHVVEHAKCCLLSMKQVDSEAVPTLESFSDFVESNQPSRVEEAFTAAFDLQPVCHPYIGYQLCGESQQRTMFMLKLRELYRHFDFEPGNDLPDHISEMLRFLGSINDCECRDEIIRDGLLPALDKLTKGIESDRNPYLGLLFSLQSYLAGTTSSGIERMSTERKKECLS